MGPLVRIPPQVEHQRHPKRREGVRPGLKGGLYALLHENQLPVVVAQGCEVAVVREVEDLVARADVRLSGEERQDVVAVQVHLV